MSIFKIINAFVLACIVGVTYTDYIEQEITSIYVLYLSVTLLSVNILNLIKEYWESKS